MAPMAMALSCRDPFAKVVLHHIAIMGFAEIYLWTESRGKLAKLGARCQNWRMPQGRRLPILVLEQK